MLKLRGKKRKLKSCHTGQFPSLLALTLNLVKYFLSQATIFVEHLNIRLCPN